MNDRIMSDEAVKRPSMGAMMTFYEIIMNKPDVINRGFNGQ